MIALLVSQAVLARHLKNALTRHSIVTKRHLDIEIEGEDKCKNGDSLQIIAARHRTRNV